MRDTTSFFDKAGWASDKVTMVQKGTADLIDQSTTDLAGQTTGDWIDREVIGGLISAEGEVVGGFIRDNDTQAGTAVGEGISLATETNVDNGVEFIDGIGEGISLSGVEGLSNGYGEGITSDAFNVGG